jgi:hypothetical protein|tara:strand:- start:9 stop:248 length:240 start_codon:yes stop_codon:yes gene_type:complete
MDPNRGLIKKMTDAPDKPKPLASKGQVRGANPNQNPLAPNNTVDRTTYKMQAISQANNISDKIDFKGFESVNLENEEVK